MKRISILLPVLIFLSGTYSPRVLGQPADTLVLRPLTLGQALQTGYARNPQLEAASYGHDAAVSLKKAAFGHRLPNLSVAANYTYMSKDIGRFDFNRQKNDILNGINQLGSLIPPEQLAALQQLLGPDVISGFQSMMTGLRQTDLSYTLQKRDFATVGAAIAVPLWTGGKINAANNAARITVERSTQEIEQLRSELFAEITERYWGLTLSKHIEELQSEVMKGMEHHLSDAVELEKNGMIARGERLFAEMALSDARTSWEKSKRDAVTTNTALSGSLGEEGRYMPETPLFVTSEIESAEYFKARAKENSPLLRQVSLSRELAEQGVKLKKSKFFPEIAAMGALDIYNYNLSDQLPKWIVGAGIKFNLFDGLTREHEYSAAKSQARQVEAFEKKAATDVLIAVEKLHNELLGSREQVESMAVTLEFAEEYLRIKEEAFREGMAPSSDVVDARLNLAKVRTERLAAAYKFDLILSQLLAITGQSGGFESYQGGYGYQRIY